MVPVLYRLISKVEETSRKIRERFFHLAENVGGTDCPSPKEHNVHGTDRPRAGSPKGRIVQGTDRPGTDRLRTRKTLDFH
jgi:hypothetical protein